MVERGTEAGKGTLTLLTVRLGIGLLPTSSPRCLREFATIDIVRLSARPFIRPYVRRPRVYRPTLSTTPIFDVLRFLSRLAPKTDEL